MSKTYFLMEVVGLILLGFFAFSEMVFFEKLIGLTFGVFLFAYPTLISEEQKIKKVREEAYRAGEIAGEKEGTGKAMDIYDLSGRNFLVVDVCAEKYLFAKLPWLRTGDNYRFVEFDPDREVPLSGIESGEYYMGRGGLTKKQ